MPKFIQPVSMSLSYDDFIADNLKQDLINLGYKFQDFNANERVLFTNYGTNSNIISSGYDSHKTANDRYYINKYNPQLFLAIAAMTEGEEWIIGEYLVYIHENDVIFKVKELKYADWKLGRAANSVTNRTLYRKATLNELVKHFSMKKKDKEIIGYKLIKPEYEKIALKSLEISNKKAYTPFIIAGMISYYLPKIKELGIMDWFEPVYKKEFKVGGYMMHNDQVYPIIKIENERLYYYNNQYITIDEFVTVPTKKQIEKLSITYFRLNDNDYVRVKNNKVYHSASDITQFVLELGECYTNIEQKFATYDAILDIDSVEFTKTGCVCKTKLSTWLEIYKFITQNKKEI